MHRLIDITKLMEGRQMKTRLYQACLMSLLSGAFSLASAETEVDIPTRGPIPFSVYDLDGSGMIDAREFSSIQEDRQHQRAAQHIPKSKSPPPPTFDDYDRNGDGGINEDELLAGQKAQMLKRVDMMDSGKPPGVGMGHVPLFSEFDLNNDGVIMEHEFLEAQQARASERARQGYMMRGLGNGRAFSDYDLNHDGEVPHQEFSAAQASEYKHAAE
jgi:Ca2+-binding EF-hand superfamily protein